MDTPGSILKDERLKQKKTLEEIADKLKINIAYLRSIEDNNYSLLPASVFTKAYMRMYADILGLDGYHISSLYEDSTIPPPSGNPPSARRKLSDYYKPALITASLIIFIFLTFLLRNDEVRDPVASPVTETGIQSDAVNSEDVTGKELSLKVTATELTWISVSTDGGSRSEWLLREGDEITVSAHNNFALKIGNAGGTRLSLNSRDLGKLGPYGKVIDINLP